MHFFHILLNLAADQKLVWVHGSLQLKPPRLDYFKEKSTTTHLWVRLYHLPWELWDIQIIFDIARCISVPIRFYLSTIDGDFEHFQEFLLM